MNFKCSELMQLTYYQMVRLSPNISSEFAHLEGAK